MVLLLCPPDDAHALWLAARLRARGREVELVLPEELLIGSRLQLRVASEGLDSEARLARGVLLPHRCEGVINRLQALPPLRAASGRAADAAYLEEEWRAAIVAWLAALDGEVLNRPTGVSLCGPRFADAHWRWLATQSGLAVLPWSAGTACELPAGDDDGPGECVFVVDGQVIDPGRLLSPPACTALAALAQAAQLRLCGASFDCTAAQPRLMRLDPLAPLAAGGPALVEAIESALGLS